MRNIRSLGGTLFLELTDIERIIDQLAGLFAKGDEAPSSAFRYLGGPQQMESALSAPAATYGGRFLHETLHAQAAALLRSLVLDHPLVDGNKRLALAATDAFLLINEHFLLGTQQERVEISVQIALGNMDLDEITRWIETNCHTYEAILALGEGTWGTTSQHRVFALVRRMREVVNEVSRMMSRSSLE